MQTPSDEYSVEVDEVTENSWYEVLQEFRDASIYQTWAYDWTKVGKSGISHLLLKKQKRVVGAAQSRIIRIPIIGAGVADVQWGPLWKRHDSENNLDDFGEMVRALQQEYVDRRGLVLRIVPNEIDSGATDLGSILEGSGFRCINRNYRTLYLDLRQPLDEIRNKMSKNWRKNLRKAEAKGLTVVEGTDAELFDVVDWMYRETVSRKGFEASVDVRKYQGMQARLPNSSKMQIMICHSEERAVAVLVGSAIGEVGIELIAATSSDGLDLGGSYLLRMKMAEHLKRCGCHFYNLNGISPEKNPGGYQFKSGFCGKTGLDVCFVGAFETYGWNISGLSARVGEMAVQLSQRAWKGLGLS